MIRGGEVETDFSVEAVVSNSLFQKEWQNFGYSLNSGATRLRHVASRAPSLKFPSRAMHGFYFGKNFV